LIAVARFVQHQRTGGMSAGCWSTAGHGGLLLAYCQLFQKTNRK
jgi:hypothetical protein